MRKKLQKYIDAHSTHTTTIVWDDKGLHYEYFWQGQDLRPEQHQAEREAILALKDLHSDPARHAEIDEALAEFNKAAEYDVAWFARIAEEDAEEEAEELKAKAEADAHFQVDKPYASLASSKNDLNIQINGNYIDIESLPFGNTNELYDDFIYIDIIKHRYNIYNLFNRGTQHTLKIMNLLALGNTIIFSAEGHEYPIGKPSTAFIETQQLAQLRYLVVTRGYKRLLPKSRTLFDTYFTSWDAGFNYLQSQELDTEIETSNRFSVLNNMIRDTLLDIEQDRADSKLLITQRFREDEVMSLSPYLESLLPDVYDYSTIPNQDTTAPTSPRYDYHIEFGMDQLGSVKQFNNEVWVSPGETQQYTTVDKMVQYACNAYFYSQPEFRVPTHEQLEEELEMLHAQYEDLKRLAKTDPNKAIEEARAFTDGYVRMTELMETLNTEPHGNLQY